MSDTPISDRLSCDGKAHYMALETARQIERMAGELAEAICEGTLSRQRSALARWQAMKDAAK